MGPREIKDYFHLCFQSFQIVLAASLLRQLCETCNWTLVKLILNFTRPHTITWPLSTGYGMR
jgi:hypothetical protein